MRQHLRAQVAEPAVAEDDDAVVTVDRHLRRNLECRSHRFREDGDVSRHVVRHDVQVALWNGNVIGERAVVIQDPEDGSVRAVRWSAGVARRTRPAAAVDLSDDALAFERARLRDADELVAEHAAESHVAANELKIGLADASAEHTNQHLAVTRRRRLIVAPLGKRVAFEDEGAHQLA